MPSAPEFADELPQLVPDPPRAHVQFSVSCGCVNTGDEESPGAGVRIDLLDAGGVLITGIGRDVVPLLPGETDGTAPTSAPWAAATAA